MRSPLLDRSAQSKLDDMIARNYWSHDTPSGDKPWVFFDRVGYPYVLAGEYLADNYDMADGVIAGWMSSEKNRENVLAPGFTEIGIAARDVWSGQFHGLLVVAHYGRPQ